MSPLLISQLILQLGPLALDLIPKLAALWHKDELTLDEVNSLCSVAKTSYDDYILKAAASIQARLSPPVASTAA